MLYSCFVCPHDRLSEIGMALKKAGKEPTRGLVKKLIKRYDTAGNGTLEFNEFQCMLNDWKSIMQEFDMDALNGQVEDAVG